MVAFIVVTFDRRFLGPRRSGNIGWQRMLATWIPNAFAAAISVAALAIMAP
jgi:ABC-type multidrug transport system permease subunit